MLYDLGFLPKKNHKRLSQKIIYNHRDISFATSSFSSHWIPKMHVKKIERPSGPYLLNLLVWTLSLFSFHAPTTNGFRFTTTFRDTSNFFSIHYVHKIPIFIWPSLLCQSSVGSSLALLHIGGFLELRFMAL